MYEKVQIQTSYICSKYSFQVCRQCRVIKCCPLINPQWRCGLSSVGVSSSSASVLNNPALSAEEEVSFLRYRTFSTRNLSIHAVYESKNANKTQFFILIS